MKSADSRRTAVVMTAVVAFCICYGRVIVSLADIWSTNYLYSYGFAVPFIAGYIAWSRARETSTVDDAPDYLLGVPVTFVGMVMLFVGTVAAIGLLEQTSLVVTLVGLVLVLFGRMTLRTHWFAIACLLLMIPIWNYPIDLLQDPSRILSARIAVGILRVIGFPVFRQGTNIMLPEHTLAVLRECSGVNQLIALTAMVLPAAYLWLPTVTRRAAIIAIGVAVSYLGNGVRIALTGWLTVKGLSDGNPGTLHLSEGLAISAIGYIVIGSCFSLLSKPGPSGPVPPHVASDGTAAQGWFASRRVAIDLTILIVLLIGGSVRLSALPGDVPLRDELSQIDSRVGDWVIQFGQEQATVPLPFIDDDFVGAYPTVTGSRRFADVDDELVRAYQTRSGSHVQVYIGYYRRQEEAKDLASEIGHDLERAAASLTIDGENGPVQIKEIVRERSGNSRGALYWYDINGRVVSDIYSVKSRTLWDALTRRRTNGAVILVAWTAPNGEAADKARQEARRFAEALMPVLRRHLPS